MTHSHCLGEGGGGVMVNGQVVVRLQVGDRLEEPSAEITCWGNNGSLGTRLNTFVFLYIGFCLNNFTVLAESSLVLNFHTRYLLLVFT